MRRVHDAWIWPLLHRGLRLGPVAVMGHVGSCSFLLMSLPASTLSDTPSFLSIFYPSSQIHFSDYKSDSPPFKKKKKNILLESVVGKRTPLMAGVVSTLPASPPPWPLCVSHAGLVPVAQTCHVPFSHRTRASSRSHPPVAFAAHPLSWTARAAETVVLVALCTIVGVAPSLDKVRGHADLVFSARLTRQPGTPSVFIVAQQFHSSGGIQ